MKVWYEVTAITYTAGASHDHGLNAHVPRLYLPVWKESYLAEKAEVGDCTLQHATYLILFIGVSGGDFRFTSGADMSLHDLGNKDSGGPSNLYWKRKLR